MNHPIRLLVVASFILTLSGGGTAHALDIKTYHPNQCTQRCKTVRGWNGNGYVKQRICIPRCRSFPAIP